MTPRKYTKSIEVWKTTTVADGYGGNVDVELLYNNKASNEEILNIIREHLLIYLTNLH